MGFELVLVVIGTDCKGSCKSNYHMIMTDPHLPIINRKLSTITKEAIESESECATCDRHTLLIVHFHVNIDTQL